MKTVLTALELRILGCLIEKELSTPDYYPLTINSLKLACNQKSNRDPVSNLDEATVQTTLDGLIKQHLAWQKPTSDSRVPKYAHRMEANFRHTKPELAILAELFLRGPQSLGELRTRCARMHSFADTAEVEQALAHLGDEDFGPYVVKLPPSSGKREARFAHLFAGEVVGGAPPEFMPTVPGTDSADLVVIYEELTALRREVQELRDRVELLELQRESENASEPKIE